MAIERLKQQSRGVLDAAEKAGSSMQDKTRSLKETVRKGLLVGAVGAAALFGGMHIAQSSDNAKLAYEKGEVAALTGVAKSDNIKLASDSMSQPQHPNTVYLYKGQCEPAAVHKAAPQSTGGLNSLTTPVFTQPAPEYITRFIRSGGAPSKAVVVRITNDPTNTNTNTNANANILKN